MRRFFTANGWVEATGVQGADCVVLFTCAEMRYKVANMVREVQRLSALVAPPAVFMVGACLAKTDAAALAPVFQGPTLTPTDFSALDRLPGIRVRTGEMPAIFGPLAAPAKPPTHAPWTGLDAIPYRMARWTSVGVRRLVPTARGLRLSARLGRTRRTTIHASAGCAHRCSYCAIRFATGAVRSKPIDAIVKTISDGLAAGYRTFDLLSDSIGGYGLDLGTDLGALLDRLALQPGRFAIGISDLHPQEFVKFFDQIVRLAEGRRLHYLYVPMQSANPEVLRRMRRQGDVADLAARFRTIRCYPDVFLQTGIIAGFPGETEEAFGDTLAFLQEVGFDGVYVHYYCDMPGTEASRLQGKIDKQTMAGRLERVRRAGIRFDEAKTQIEWDSTSVLP